SLRDRSALSGGGMVSAGTPASPWSRSNWQYMAPSVGHVPRNPAVSTSSVGGMWACACKRCLMTGSLGGNFVVPSGGGKLNPAELSKGSREGAWNRPFHIRDG